MRGWCACCGNPGPAICAACAAELTALAQMGEGETRGLAATALYAYRDLVRALAIRAKVQGDQRAMRTLVALAVARAEALALARWADVVVVAPSSLWGRLRGRLDLASHLAHGLGEAATRPVVPAPPHLYWRLKKRALTSGDERRAEAAVAGPAPSPVRLQRWAERVRTLVTREDGVARIALVDDVTTSGRTLRETADAVRAGLPEACVRALVMAAARVPNRT